MNQNELIERFVASFEKLDGPLTTSKEVDPVAWELRVVEPDEWGDFDWKPLKKTADRAMLDPIYAKLPAKFPPLFELLVLSYRWPRVYLPSFSLLPNPPGPDLSGLLSEISRDPAIWEALIPAGYIQFGRGPDMDYDPVCFSVRSRTKKKDYAIVKIDHEEILCNNRVKVVAELAPSFEQLVLDTVEDTGRI